MDALYDTMQDVPDEVKTHKRYQKLNNYAMKELSEEVEKDAGPIDILVHSLANAPEVKKPLLETSRQGYLQAMSSSSYSFISLVNAFGGKMAPRSSILSGMFQSMGEG